MKKGMGATVLFLAVSFPLVIDGKEMAASRSQLEAAIRSAVALQVAAERRTNPTVVKSTDPVTRAKR